MISNTESHPLLVNRWAYKQKGVLENHLNVLGTLSTILLPVPKGTEQFENSRGRSQSESAVVTRSGTLVAFHDGDLIYDLHGRAGHEMPRRDLPTFPARLH